VREALVSKGGRILGEPRRRSLGESERERSTGESGRERSMDESGRERILCETGMSQGERLN
jgi:hypothetical protein